MLVKYRGNQTAICVTVGGVALRFAKGDSVLISTKQAERLSESAYIQNLVKKDLLSLDDLSGHDKTALEELAATNKIDIPPKATAKDIKRLLVDDLDNEDYLHDTIGADPEAEAKAKAELAAKALAEK